MQCLPTLLSSICITQPARYDRWFLLHYFSGPHIPIYFSEARALSHEASVWTETNLFTGLNHPNTVSLSLSVLSLSPSSPLSGQVLWGPRVSYKILLWALWPRQGASLQSVMPSLSSAPPLMPSTTMASSPRFQVQLPSSLSSLYPSPTWQNREHPLPFQHPIVTSSSSTLTCRSLSISHPWPSFFLSFTGKTPPFSQRATQLSCLFFWLRNPRSHREPNPVDIWFMGMIAFTRIHKRNTSSLLSLCIAIITYVLLCGYPPFSCRQPHCPPLAKRRPQNWIRFWSIPVLHSTCCHPRFTASSYCLGGFTLPLTHHHHHHHHH